MRISTRNPNPRARMVERFSGFTWSLSRSGMGRQYIETVSVSTNMGNYDHTAYNITFTANDEPEKLSKLIEALTQLRDAAHAVRYPNQPRGTGIDADGEYTTDGKRW